MDETVEVVKVIPHERLRELFPVHFDEQTVDLPVPVMLPSHSAAPCSARADCGADREHSYASHYSGSCDRPRLNLA